MTKLAWNFFSKSNIGIDNHKFNSFSCWCNFNEIDNEIQWRQRAWERDSEVTIRWGMQLTQRTRIATIYIGLCRFCFTHTLTNYTLRLLFPDNDGKSMRMLLLMISQTIGLDLLNFCSWMNHIKILIGNENNNRW